MSSESRQILCTSGGDASDRTTTPPERDYYDRPEHLEVLAHAGPAPDWAYDLVKVARAAYLIDRRVQRKSAPDRWTRTLELTVQLLAPEPWTEAVRDELGSLLSTLTGDTWRITVAGGAARPPETLVKIRSAHEVALFSGGLDSTSFAAQRSAVQEGPLFLVTCGQAPLTRQVNVVHDAVCDGKGRCMPLQRMPLMPLSDGCDMDLSNRSRGLVFVASGVLFAAAHGVTTVSTPENGQVAINPPLTLSRLAACSTRSVHPWVLGRANRLIEAIGGDVTVSNPLAGYTKGEVCTAAERTGLSGADLSRTVSCAHPLSARRGSASYHCGFCFPCLIRRSGMFRALGNDPTPYRRDLRDIALEKDGNDLRAVARWLSRPFTALDLVADMPLPDDVSPHDLVPVLHRGRHELVAMIEHSLPAAVLRALAWDPQP
jgi:hypothetical protein